MESLVLAYIDPGAGSAFLQLLLAGVAGAAVLLRLAWTRLKSRFVRSSGPDSGSHGADGR